MKYKIVYKSLGGADNVADRIQFNNENLRDAVNDWYDDEEQARVDYGDINTWDVSQVTNMSGLFANKFNFNQNIGNWDVSNVTDMENMFYFAHSFNNYDQAFNTRRIEREDGTTYTAWDVSNVTNMRNMFYFANLFNQDISNWNTSNLTNMRGMFNGATSFNQDISNWNTSNVTNMRGMFYFASVFNQDIGNWNTSNVTDMMQMFRNTPVFNQDIGNWNTSNVTDMSYMFYSAQSFNQYKIGYWIIRDDCSIIDMFRNSGITRETFEGRVYGEKIANYFDPPLPNARSNTYLKFNNPRGRIQDRIQFKLAMNAKYKDLIKIWDKDDQLVFLEKIPEYIDREINPDFPFSFFNRVKNPDFPKIINRGQLIDRLNEINNRNDNDYTEDENTQFNLNNEFIDNDDAKFDLFIINIEKKRIMLFELDENNDLIFKKKYPFLNDDLVNLIGTYVGGNNNKLYNDYKNIKSLYMTTGDIKHKNEFKRIKHFIKNYL